MPRYSEERKAAVLKKLLSPDVRSVASTADEESPNPEQVQRWMLTA